MPRFVPRVRRLAFHGESIGMGIDSRSGLAMSTALEGFTVEPDPTAFGGEAFFSSATIVTTHEELMETIRMSPEAEGRYAFFSASAKADFAHSTKYNSMSTFVVARSVVEGALKRGSNFLVREDARQLFESEGIDEFSAYFGDGFVRGLQTGGEFYCVVRITSVSPAKQNELGAMVRGAFDGLFTSAEVKAAFEEANKVAHTRAELSTTIYQNPGTGPQISPVITIEDALTRFKSFAAAAHDSPAAYETEVETYDTLGLQHPTLEEKEDFLFALRDAQEKKLHYIEKKNDLQFAFENPMFFVDLPPREVLKDAINTYIELVNAVTKHALSVSRGETTYIFDPSELSHPLVKQAPIPYKLPKLGV